MVNNSARIDNRLIIRYLRGECNNAEKKQVETHLASSDEARKHFNGLRRSIELAEDIVGMESVDINGGYAKLQQMISRRRRTRWQNRISRYAALVSIPLLLSTLILGYMYICIVREEVQYVEIKAPAGSVIHYELPDKSEVWLNSRSVLRHPARFPAKCREVELSGEAYFNVMASKRSPFRVNTSDGVSVCAYGTSFNVCAYEDESYIEAALEKGSIGVTLPGRGSEVRLNPGEYISFDKSTARLRLAETDIYEKTAWREGKMIFRNAPLAHILKKLGEHFNTDIELINLTGKEYCYRATFKDETLQQILDYLGTSADLTWEVTGSIQKPDNTITRKHIVVKLH